MKVVLANPRGFCAGVVRAIDIVTLSLERFGPPIYVRHDIVHNNHVVADFVARGVVFVEDLRDVPTGTRVIFSAHGVGPAVWREAADRDLAVIDATCPLVIKVHQEVAAYSRIGYTVFLIGHRGHPEVVGTLGHYEENLARIHVIESVLEAELVKAEDPDKVGYATQTTLATDAVAPIVSVLARRFPKLRAPHASDICYATQNRQRAVRELAQVCDVILVVGAQRSSNSVRLREVAEAAGVPARLADSAAALERDWFWAAETIGLTSGASVPEMLVAEVLLRLRSWWPDITTMSIGETETLQFRPPRELERARPAAPLAAAGGKAVRDTLTEGRSIMC
jgi:4-hydroxy-3-methylbut-2-en-1-yl diphosphate reductase